MLIRLKRLKRKGRGYKRSLRIIPYIFTFLNAIFGFLSIIRSFEGNYKVAACYIIIAAILDGFDGRLARAFGSSSYFGMELDSLCDAISFCLAPAVLIYCWIPIGNIAKIALAFYVCAGLARLAKFNTNSDNHTSYFIGLPTTLAASFIAFLIFYHSWLSSHGVDFIYHASFLLSVVITLSLLMISPIRFASFKYWKIQKPRDYYTLVSLVFVLLWLIAHRYPILLCSITGYILVNIGIYLYQEVLYKVRG